MDWLTFFSSVIDSLAWPSAFFAVWFVIYKELPSTIRSLRKLRFKDVELEFGEAARAVAAETKKAVPVEAEASLAGGARADVAEHLNLIAELAPRAAIVEAWLQVEAAAADLVAKRSPSISLRRMPAPMELRQALRRLEVLSRQQLTVFDSLRNLRNEAVHVPDAQFPREAVLSYIDSALTMAAYLESAANK